MSPSEIAFLAVGLILGAGVGAAVVEAPRARPAPRGQVRDHDLAELVGPTADTTLSDPTPAAARPVPGSPEDGGWTRAPRVDPADRPPPSAPGRRAFAVPVRTPVPSPAAGIPATAVGVPVEGARPSPSAPARRRRCPRSRAGLRRACLTPRAAHHAPVPARHLGWWWRGAVPARLGSRRARRSRTPRRPRRPRPDRAAHATSSAPRRAVPCRRPRCPTHPGPARQRRRRRADRRRARRPAAPARGRPTPDPRGRRDRGADRRARRTGREATDECRPVDPPGDRSRRTPATLPPARRRALHARVRRLARARPRRHRCASRGASAPTTSLHGLLDQAEKASDPRELAVAKDELHRRFRAASDAAAGAEAAEAAARAVAGRDQRPQHARTRGAAVPRERPRGAPGRVAADRAARGRGGDGTQARRDGRSRVPDARESLAACEEASEARRAHEPAAPTPADEPASVRRALAGRVGVDPDPAAGRARRRAARGRRLPSRSGSCAATGRRGTASLRARRHRRRGLAGVAPPVSRLVDAIAARAIEDGYLDLPDEDAVLGPVHVRGAARDRRRALGARLPVRRARRVRGRAGPGAARPVARRRLRGPGPDAVRTWPREAELARLYEHAAVAADDWLVDMADDLSLGRMVDALGARAGDLADTWNAWGRVRPLLLATG